MPSQPAELALLRAVLRDDCPSDDIAEEILQDAWRIGVDPLDYCAHRYGLGTIRVGSRAAHWAGFPFAGELPSSPLLHAGLASVNGLWRYRAIRMQVGEHDIAFFAAGFAEVLRLRRLAGARPDLARLFCLTPRREIDRILTLATQAALLDNARQQTVQVWPHAAASQELPKPLRVGFVVALALLVVLVTAGTAVGAWPILPVLALLLVVPGLVRIAAAVPAGPPADEPPLGDAALPVYSVLVPLRDEARMVPMLAMALRAFDYPPEKLDIRFIVEATSLATVEAVRQVLDDPRFSLVIVPDDMPRTKPKALDFALPSARGELIVVYDAEDIPAPDQLRRVAACFAANRRIACVQAVLVAENADDGWLPALFAGEYAGLFCRLLPALARWGLPVPLGGTSNHFRTRALRLLGGWDAFNVTEDADLGVRLARRHLRTATLPTRTYEEAPIAFSAWMAQRTRWAKGWMQTLLVHNRRPRELLHDLGWRGFLAFELMVGSMVVSSLLHTAFLLSLLVRIVVLGPAILVPSDPWAGIGLAILAIGYGGALAISVSGLVGLGRKDLLPVQALLPIYWILHSVAVVRAGIDLINRPHFWSKTTHGLTQKPRGRQARADEPARRRQTVTAQAE